MTKRIPWTVAVPPLAIVLLALTWHRSLPGPVVAVVAIFLAGAVLAPPCTTPRWSHTAWASPSDPWCWRWR
jgi:hypothetical protein